MHLINQLWTHYYNDTIDQAKQRNWSLSEVNQQDNNGQTLLMIASIDNNKKWVEYLLEIGADENIVDYQGYKAITLAAKLGLDKVMIHFLKTGAGG